MSHKIDLSHCTGCELCIIICPAAILAKNDAEEVFFQADKVGICIKCGHCMAMCEAAAITIEGLSYETNFRPVPQTNWNHSAFMDFLLARRSVRIFKDKPVPVEVLQKVIDAIATAPFGVNPQNVDAHIYLTYSLLAAHSLGLGATAIGLIGPAINQSKPLRQLFRIPEGNEVVESMIAGYPKFPFKRAIVRPRKKVTFIT